MMTFEQTLTRQAELAIALGNAITNLKKIGAPNYTHAILTTRINSTERNWTEFLDNHRYLCTLRTEATAKDGYYTENVYGATEEEYLKAISYHYTCLESLPRPATLTTASSAPAVPTPTAKQLPRINLPQFTGKFTDWADYRDLFVSMVTSNATLTNVERLHYLKTSMTGEATQLLKNISTIGDNFERAWTILTNRFENKRLLVSAHLNALTSIRAATSESSSELKLLLNGTTSARGALEQLKRPVKHWDDLLVHLTVQKLDAGSRREWETINGAKTEFPTFAELETFIDTRVNTLEALGGPQTSTRTSGYNDGSRQAKKSHHAATVRESTCALCSASHFILNCNEFKAKTPEQRREIVLNKNLCYNCLGAHRIAECRSSKRCIQCSGHHHTLLHSTTGGTPAAPGTTAHLSTTYTSNAQLNAFVSLTPGPAATTQVLLATALIHVQDANGTLHVARALIDQGSETSFASDALIKRLQLPRQHAIIPIHGIGGAHVTATRGRTTVKVSSRHDASFKSSIDALILPSLTQYRPSVNTLSSDWTHLHSLELADNYKHDGLIELILGADIYSTILCDGIRRGPVGSPLAQHTRFGWILSGPISVAHNKLLSLPTAVCNNHLYIGRSSSSSTRVSHGGRHRSSYTRGTISSYDEAGGMFTPKALSWRS